MTESRLPKSRRLYAWEASRVMLGSIQSHLLLVNAEADPLAVRDNERQPTTPEGKAAGSKRVGAS
ncbi:MAG: hypothetical protein RLZ25_1201 [Pseudomonadota bacterium]